MKFIHALLFVLMSVFSFGAFASVTVQQAEIAMHAAEADKSKLADAEVILRQAVKENPDSYKANFYLSQVLTAEKKPDAFVYTEKAQDIKSDKASSSFMNFLMFLFMLSVIGGIAYFGYKFYLSYQIKAKEAREAQLKEVYRQKLLAELLEAKQDIEDAQLKLTVKKVTKHPIVRELQELNQHALDAIEILHEKGDFDEIRIRDLIDTVSQAVTYIDKAY